MLRTFFNKNVIQVRQFDSWIDLRMLTHHEALTNALWNLIYEIEILS